MFRFIFSRSCLWNIHNINQIQPQQIVWDVFFFFDATSFILPLSPDTPRYLSLSHSRRFREHDECPGTITWAWPSWYFRSKHTLVGGNKCLFEYSELFYLLVLCVYRVACSFGPSMHVVDQQYVVVPRCCRLHLYDNFIKVYENCWLSPSTIEEEECQDFIE